MKKITSLTMVVLMALLLAGCQHTRTRVTLAASKNLWNSLPLIAIEKNYFAEEGLDVSVNYLEAGRFCMDAVLSKSADFGDVVDVNVGYLGYSQNKNITLTGEISGTLASEIVARKSRGISSPADLKGKSLAYSPGTTSDVFARRFLEKNGIPDSSLTLLKIQPKGMVAAMVAKDGPDASSTWEPFVSAMRKGLGEDMITFEAPDVYTAREYVAVRTDWAKENSSTVIAFLKALKKADDFALSNKEQAQEIVARMTGLDLAIVQSSWAPYQIKLEYDKDKYLREITQIGQEISQLADYKGQQVPDYSTFLDDTYFHSMR